MSPTLPELTMPVCTGPRFELSFRPELIQIPERMPQGGKDTSHLVSTSRNPDLAHALVHAFRKTGYLIPKYRVNADWFVLRANEVEASAIEEAMVQQFGALVVLEQDGVLTPLTAAMNSTGK